MSESSNGTVEIVKEAAKESVSQGFGLIKSLLKNSPHVRAVDSYIASIEADETLTREQKAVCTWNAKKNIKRAANTISICERSIEEGVTESKLLAVDPDWIDYFFEHAAAASLEDMQRLWARILAQECDEPESMPKALIHTLSIMSKKEAESFMHLASFSFVIHFSDGRKQYRPLVYLHEVSKYQMTLEELAALESIGLLHQYPTGITDSFDDGDSIGYFGREIKAVDMNVKTDVPTGSILLSHTGEALMRIVAPVEAEGFYEKAIDPLFHGKEMTW